jgi:fatty-acyl-CoA synthase
VGVTLSLTRRAERFPDRTAIVDISEERLYAPTETIHEDRVSYGELSRIAGHVAGALEERGVEPGDTVCLVTRNRVASLAFPFACRRLRATFAPISHRLTPATVQRPFDVLDPSLVVAEAAQRDLVRSIPSDRTVTLTELADAAADSPTIDSARQLPGSEPALLGLHGEAGHPVVGFGANTVEWNCIDAVVAWGLSRDDSALALDPFSTPDGLLRTALPLLYVGGRLLLDRAFDPEDALTAIDAHDVTVLSGRGAPIRGLLRTERANVLDVVDRVVVDHGVDKSVTTGLLDHDVAVSRAYGRLECPTATSQSVDEQGRHDGVGRPVLDCEVRLVDDDGSVLDGAATGTLQLSGPVVAAGFLGPKVPDDGAEDRPTGTTGPDGRGRFLAGWFDTGEAFCRTDSGEYVRRS